MDSTNSFRDLFLLDPDVVFLNHGSFGATPRPVFEVYQAWQRQIERQPVKFIGRELTGYLQTARHALGTYLHVQGDDLVYIPNATFGVNIVARALSLTADDEVLTTDHEYGACDRVWRFVSQKKGFRYVRQPIPLPAPSPEEIVEQLWQGVTPRTKIIYLSHITSATALRLPVEAICHRAREAGILTLVDGAHAPGQIPLDLTSMGADFYTGNCHKWLSAPKGSAFLYARREVQPLLEPLVVSWGWESERPSGSNFLDHLEYLGTDDLSSYLSVPAAIQFQADHNWSQVQQQCHELAKSTLAQLCQLTGLNPLYPADNRFFQQLVIAPLPPTDLDVLKRRLYDEYRVEVPLISWNGHQFIRVSVQAYNTPADIEVLLTALDALL
ncbi:MAG: aminotransferase class V-fold PLP-dependent enzyme [Ardenticatenaceae bacterium]|nr:aminotransferase class V-fold PLP-dependent enzyme [Ardenticatenaceae bacterium]